MTGTTAQRYAHPGTPMMPRHIAVKARSAQYFDAHLTGEVDLFSFAREVAHKLKTSAAMLLFQHIALRRAAFHVCEDDSVHGRILRYSQPVVLDAPCELITAHMSVGQQDGQTLLHCHGALQLADGAMVGGHLAQGMCITQLGTKTVRVLCLALDGVQLQTQHDEETGFSLLCPTGISSSSITTGASAVEVLQ